MNNSSRSILITGATRGIGLETARQCAVAGCQVWIGGRKRAGATALLKEFPETCAFLNLDVLDPDRIAAASRAIETSGRGLDVLVNNAAILIDRTESVLELDEITARTTLETNVLGPLRVAQAFVPLLQRSRTPRIINVSSGGGQLSDPSTWAPAYCLSKTALNALTVQLAATLPTFAVNSVCPGWVRTDMGGRDAPRSVGQGADTIVWLATEAPQKLSGKFLRDRKIIDW